MSEPEFITVKGAREHNLKSVYLEIPKKKLVVFTGVSGSGKSSLAFDTLYAEGQRRYVESLSSYARQFLGQMEKPKYDTIRGLSPTIAIEQKAASNNPRSTVGHHHRGPRLPARALRVDRRAALPLVRPAGRQADGPADRRRDPRAARRARASSLLAPLVQNRKGEYRDLLDDVAEARLRARARGRDDRTSSTSGSRSTRS